jgi:predicted NAD/FAD-dependent oxidoreductase
MATRRVGESRFDHGAQFIKHSERTQKIIDFWEQQKILKKFSSHLFNAS